MLPTPEDAAAVTVVILVITLVVVAQWVVGGVGGTRGLPPKCSRSDGSQPAGGEKLNGDIADGAEVGPLCGVFMGLPDHIVLAAS